MKIFIKIKILILLIPMSVHSKIECEGLFEVSPKISLAGGELKLVMQDMHALRLVMNGTDHQAAVVAKYLFDQKYRQLSEYFSEYQIQKEFLEVNPSWSAEISKTRKQKQDRLDRNRVARDKIYSLVSYLRTKELAGLGDRHKSKDYSFSALHFMIHESREDLIDAIVFLKDENFLDQDLFKGFNINSFGYHRNVKGGMSIPLVYAAILNQEGMVRMLVKLGADVNFSGSSKSPLQIVKENASPEMMSLFISLGAK